MYSIVFHIYIHILRTHTRRFRCWKKRVGEAGNSAVRIGKSLDAVDRQRIRAAESKELIEYLLEFRQGTSPKLEALRMGSMQDLYKVKSVSVD